MTAYKIDVNYNGFIKYSSITNSEIKEIKTEQTTPIHILINVGKGFDITTTDITTTDITLLTTEMPDISTTPITTTSTETATVTPTITPTVTVTPTITPTGEDTSTTPTVTPTNDSSVTPKPDTTTPTTTKKKSNEQL